MAKLAEQLQQVVEHRASPEMVKAVREEAGKAVGKAKPGFKADLKYSSKELNLMYALYCQPEPVKVKGVDEVNVGFGLYNSIDGSSGFGVSSFTFRFGCGNLVIMGSRGQQLNSHYTDVLAWASKRHTSGLKVDRPNLQKFILTVLDKSKEVIDLYREMAVQKMNETVAKRIAESSLPQRALPDHIEFKTVDDRRELTKFDQNRTIWDIYNSVTEAIWHNVKSDLGTKVNQFGAINEAVLPVLRA